MVSLPRKHLVESQSVYLTPKFSSTFNIGMPPFCVYSLLLQLYSMEISGHTESPWRSISGESGFLIVCFLMGSSFQHFGRSAAIQREVGTTISRHSYVNAIFLFNEGRKRGIGTVMGRQMPDMYSS